MFTPQLLYSNLQSLSIPLHFCIAYSGGLDSHVLLHALAQLRPCYPGLKLRAVHINHGLSPNAEVWQLHCQRVCQDLGIAFIHYSIDTQHYDPRHSLEETAREQRYQIFSDILQPGECLLTAHHRDDQAETVLLRLLRGAGSKGLAAMSWRRPLGRGFLIRPLLDVPRVDLENYAQQEKLVWIEDESNQNLILDRNYVRQKVLPLIQSRWSSASLSLSRTAQHCQETTILLEVLAAEDLAKVQGGAVHTVSIASLKKLSSERQKNVLRFWLKGLGFLLPSAKKLNQLLQDCLTEKTDIATLLTWKGVEVRCFEGDLYAMPPLPVHDPSLVMPVHWPKNNGFLSLQVFLDHLQNEPSLRVLFEAIQGLKGVNLLQHKFWVASNNARNDNTEEIYVPSPHRITIRFRQGGEIFHPAGRVGSHPLKKLFQEWRVPPWLRNRIPLVYFDEELAIVLGYAISQKYIHYLKRSAE